MRGRRQFLRGTLAGSGGFALAGRPGNAADAGTVQNLDVYQQGELYRVRGRIDGREMKSARTADAALQFAVDRLGKSGGEVLLQCGTFRLTKQVNLSSRVSLRGSGAGTALWIEESHDTGIALMANQADAVTVSDLAIKAARDTKTAKAGVVIDNSGACSVRGVLCVGLREHGIWLRNNAFLCEVSGCQLAGTGKSGIFLEMLYRAGRGGDYVPNLVSNCIVYGGGIGIETSRAIVANIVGCEVFQSGGHGFCVRNTSNSVLISGCRTFQIGSDAVMVDTSDEINITGNVFCWHTGHGIVLKKVTWGTVTGNEVIDTGSLNENLEGFKLPPDFPYKNGIYLHSGTRGVSITGNTIFNWPVAPTMAHGILEDESCGKNVLSSNNLNFCKTDVSSRGKESQAANNVSYLPEPFRQRRPAVRLQTFNTGLLESFLDQLR